MTWIIHDTFMTKKDAKEHGEGIIEVGLAKGIKIAKTRNKIRPYALYIIPLKTKEQDNA